MIPAVTQSFGGQLYYIRGSRIFPMNMLWQGIPNDKTPGNEVNNSPHQPIAGSTWNTRNFGGRSSYFPASYANHKPMAVFEGKLYQAVNSQNGVNEGDLYITRFDGSGIFINGGDYAADPWSNGRGNEFVSASGDGHDVESNDCALLNYNGNLFIACASYQQLDNADWLAAGWVFEGSTPGGVRASRDYNILTITSNDSRRTFGASTSFTPDAPYNEATHMCDMIGYKDDIYFANWIDVVKVAGGSGTMTLIENDMTSPTAKSFAVYPSGGFSNGSSVGESWLLYQTGSGVIKRINTTRTTPSGTLQVVDLSSLATSVRHLDNFNARLNSSTAEPGRAPLLIPFNNQLHSFIPTATSGYQHFTCTGSASGISNWTNQTSQLPFNMRAWDGNVFGFVDTFRDRMYVANVTMGEVGVVGHASNQKAAGGIYIHELNNNNQWKQILKAVPGFTPRGLVPYMNTGPYVSVPSGANPVVLKCSDYAILEYKLHDLFERPLNVDIEYSIDEGSTWNSATRFKTYNPPFSPQGSGVTSLPTNLDGITYTFFWHYVNDIGFNNLQDILLRIRPKLVI